MLMGLAGIDKDTGTEGLSEFEIEIRRRLWTLLYIWDWSVLFYGALLLILTFAQANVGLAW